MKKIFKKILILTMIATLAIMPASTALASTSSYPVLLFSTPDNFSKYFMYQPSPLDVASGQTVYLLDTTTNSVEWHVPAGKSFSFAVSVPSGNFTCQVFRSGPNGGIVYNQSGTFSSFGMDFQAVSHDCFYLIFLTSNMNPGYYAQIYDYQVNLY